MGRRGKRAVILGLGVLVLAIAGLALGVDRFGHTDRARAAPVIIVLGARVLDDGSASGSLAARTAHAVALYRRGLAPLILFSGGVGEHAPAEALVARQLALDAGVPPEACLVETDSHSTAQNAEFSARLLFARGVREAIVVSDPYHLYRARQYFRHEGLAVMTSPAPLAARDLVWRQRLYWTLREVGALVVHPSLFFASRPSG
jgi:uncharacterized SAM-binding protein YcdF (DUF218 family)